MPNGDFRTFEEANRWKASESREAETQELQNQFDQLKKKWEDANRALSSRMNELQRKTGIEHVGDTDEGRAIIRQHQKDVDPIINEYLKIGP